MCGDARVNDSPKSTRVKIATSCRQTLCGPIERPHDMVRAFTGQCPTSGEFWRKISTANAACVRGFLHLPANRTVSGSPLHKYYGPVGSIRWGLIRACRSRAKVSGKPPSYSSCSLPLTDVPQHRLDSSWQMRHSKSLS